MKEISMASFASPAVPCVGRHRMVPSAMWTAYGLEAARVLAPVSAAIQGTSVSSAARSTRGTTQVTDQIAQSKATALLPTSDVAVVNGFGGLAGIRTTPYWSPPV